MNLSKRYPKIDILYTIGILLVLFGHSHSSDWSTFEGTILQSAIEFVYTFHMPLFFFIAGYLFINSKSIERVGYGKWIKEKSMKLLTPYLVLSIAALVPKYYVEYHTFVKIDYVIEAIFNPRAGVWGHFWFIPVLLLCYALFGIWRGFVTEKNKYVMIFIVTVLSIIGYFLPVSIQWLGIKDLLNSCVFFCVGMIVKTLDFKKRRVPYVIKCGIGIVVSIIIFQNVPKNKSTLLLIALIMIYSCWQLAGKIGKSKFALWIGMHNFTIYIYSWPFQAIMMAVCDKIQMKWYVTSFLMFVIGLFGPICLVYTYEKFDRIHNKVFDLILGMK